MSVRQFFTTLKWRFKSAWFAFKLGIDLKEFMYGENHGPENCPTYYDGCNCYCTVWEENKRLMEIIKNIGPNDILKRLL